MKDLPSTIQKMEKFSNYRKINLFSRSCVYSYRNNFKVNNENLVFRPSVCRSNIVNSDIKILAYSRIRMRVYCSAPLPRSLPRRVTGPGYNFPLM